MKRLLIICSCLFALGAEAQNSWEKKEAFGNDKRSRGIAFSIGNRGYYGMGEDTADIVRNDLWEYDPGTDSWMQRATLPAAGRRDAVGIAIGNKGYVGTGIDAAESMFGNNLNDWWEYNPAANTWTQKATYPGSASYNGIYFGCGFVVNGMGYIVGGKQSNSQYVAGLWQYNPATNSWLQRATFPGGTRYSMSAFTINGKAYAGLGTDENILQTDWWQYDPVTNVWLQKNNFPGTGRFAAAGFAIAQYGYVVGGSDGGYKDELWQYDAAADTWWPKAPFGGGERRSLGVFVIANAAYACCGSGFTGKRRDVWQYEQFLTDVAEGNGIAFNIFPNPSSDLINVMIRETFNPDETQLEIFSATGQIVYSSGKLNRNNTAIDLSDFAQGCYLIRVVCGNTSTTQTFIKH
jgi:N-acetylneuraminic acid mutarotase